MITPNYTSAILCESPWYWFHQASIIVSAFLLSICVVFGVLLTLTRIRMQRFTYGFHFNVTMIQVQVNYTFAILGPIVFAIQHTKAANDKTYATISNVMEFYYLFVSAFYLPALAMERICATIFIADYEKKPRRYISFLILLLNSGLSFFCAMESLTDDISNWQTFLAIVIVNLLAIFVFIFCERKNLQFYNDHLTGLSQAKYTLSRRFQLVENIKIAKFIKKLVFGAFMFNVLLGGNYFLILITSDVHTQNLFVEMFDLLSPLYGSTIPVVYLLTNKILQVDIRRAFFTCCNNSVEQDLNSKTDGTVVVDVFGRNLIQHAPEGHQYFEQLKKSWS